jgi:hypothetical protein
MVQNPALGSQFTGSAADYRRRAQDLLDAAAEAPDPSAALAYQSLANNWRNLAIEADWQAAMLTALAAVEEATLRGS